MLDMGVVGRGKGVENWGEEGRKKTNPDSCQIVNWNSRIYLSFQGSLGSCLWEAIFWYHLSETQEFLYENPAFEIVPSVGKRKLC